jgi:hypothetical protein
MAGSNSVAEALDSCLEPVSCRFGGSPVCRQCETVADNDASDLS